MMTMTMPATSASPPDRRATIAGLMGAEYSGPGWSAAASVVMESGPASAPVAAITPDSPRRRVMVIHYNGVVNDDGGVNAAREPSKASGGPGMPRAIIFDAGNTLLSMNYPVIAAELRGRGHAVSAEAVEEAELRARVRLDAALLGASTESSSTAGRYLTLLLEHLGITDEAEIREIARWRRSYNLPVGLWNRAAPGAAAALARVREAGLIAGVISNSNGSVRSILEETGLARHLDFIIDSWVVGVQKPDPRIFQLGLELAGVAAPRAMYVGDLYSVDVLGARAAGMDGILLDPRGFWAPRDCLLARDLEEAVRLGLEPRDEPAPSRAREP